MADNEDAAKAEKLAAAKKRVSTPPPLDDTVAQLQKQKAKKAAKKEKPSGESSKGLPVPDAASTSEKPDDAPQDVSNPEVESEAKTKTPDKLDDAAPETFPDASPGDAAESGERPGEDEVSASESRQRRQPSLSIQSKIRSSSFRDASISQTGLTPTGSAIKSPPLPPLSPGGNTAPELFRKQALKLEELEKENKRLEKELATATAKWRKSEEQLDDLRETNSETVELKDKLTAAEKKAEEIDQLASLYPFSFCVMSANTWQKAEISALQRQNSHLHTKSQRSSSNAATSADADSSLSALQEQLDSKSSTIEAMELEISNLRGQLSSQAENTSESEKQISTLKHDLDLSKAALRKEQQEHTSTRNSMNRMIEKTMNEGVTQASTQTLINNLKAELELTSNAKTEVEKKTSSLEKKLDALGNLHKESEIRHQSRLRERDKFEKDVLALRRRLVIFENENLRLKEERDRVQKRYVANTGDDETLDELEDEERTRLERTIRDLEGEVFDLRRGIWKERKRELAAGGQPSSTDATDALSNPGSTFDDVDLVGGLPGSSDHSRRRSAAFQKPRQHSSFATVLSSGIAAFTGSGTTHPHHSSSSGAHNSLDFLSEKETDFLDDDDMFDENAFARAQAEEEQRKRAEWERDVKRKVKEWKGWRLDLVECRYGAHGAGLGFGEVFDI
ncbi:hypothetical protein LOZ12_006148 [Ophidiomyces ophidiicola]|uniref:Uncharacterized protein n=1 Tax=Ophidiomyces ophidiicola TaxID=1387563 RepID=A0ACB8UY34_9EURO|nr:hypothetical protein LOZ62_006163 [Ophidiomyces ophidiicola]KAI1948558.1 hypothetical protein LOZ59_006330 [Ophidiomyces ophidiicola]KAI1967710.1 hypothetical protein LOZ56_005366 [Ophidiomyces ophidiicola]KAI2022086.1 hypothetical protein LOZ45_004493 [Ophidiomyces ophidiicola]KAI2032459.1 hypothetical protein LOZ47_005760 [Ophidiomyces ophidiicola]